MNERVSTTDREIKAPESIETGEVARSAAELPKLDQIVPTLDQIIEQICRDARQDSMRFAMRSDVGLDGE